MDCEWDLGRLTHRWSSFLGFPGPWNVLLYSNMLQWSQALPISGVWFSWWFHTQPGFTCSFTKGSLVVDYTKKYTQKHTSQYLSLFPTYANRGKVIDIPLCFLTSVFLSLKDRSVFFPTISWEKTPGWTRRRRISRRNGMVNGFAYGYLNRHDERLGMVRMAPEWF